MISAYDLQTAGAELVAGPEAAVFSKIVIDSRQAQGGALFVALPGERTDGHRYLKDAVAKGAKGVLVSRLPQEDLGEAAVYLTDDCLKTLGNLARIHRRRLDPVVVGITGSCGKTTTKDFLASILRQGAEVLATFGNYNNELGLPLTLLSLERQHKYAVLEMGMRGLGQIDYLCSIAEPQLGIVTNIGVTHLELLGSQEKIAQAKGELVESLPAHGMAVLNWDDPFARQLAKKNRGRTVYFGFHPEADLWAEPKGLNEAVFHYGPESIEVRLPIWGRHNIANSLAAAAAAMALGCSLQQAAEGIANAQISDLRLRLEEGRGGWQILNDTYNAAPASTMAALEVLAQLGRTHGRRTVAALADMLELGEKAPQFHRQVGEKAAELAIGRLVTVGELGREIAQGALGAGMPADKIASFSTTAEASEYLLATLAADELVLLKGSRSMAMDKVAEALRGGEE